MKKFPAIKFNFPRTEPIAGYYDIEKQTAFGYEFSCGFQQTPFGYKPVFKFDIIDWEVVYRAISIFPDTIVVVVVSDGFCTILRPKGVYKLDRKGKILDFYKFTVPIHEIPDHVYPVGYVKTNLRVFDVYQKPTQLWYNSIDSTIYYKNKYYKTDLKLVECVDKKLYRDILVEQNDFDAIVMSEEGYKLLRISDLG